MDRSRLTTIPRLTFMVGKGGVGRTTLTSAMGLTAARRRKRTLMIEVGHHQVIPGLFGVVANGYEPVECAANLWAIRVNWEDALREYGLMKLKVRTLFKMVFENPLVRRLLPAIPGISEILVIGKIVHAATDGIDGLGPMDAVFVDAPATGHMNSLVHAPSVVAATVPTGPLASSARHLAAVLSDPTFTRYHIVTLAEEMPIAESTELYRSMAVDAGLPMGPVLVNQVLRDRLDCKQRDALTAMVSAGRFGGDICAAVSGALFLADRADQQAGHIERLQRQVPLPIISLPDIRGNGEAGNKLEVLAAHLSAGLWREGP